MGGRGGEACWWEGEWASVWGLISFLPSACSSPFCFLYVKGQNHERVIQDWGRGEDSISCILPAEVQDR